jgi:hypothetical protein
MAEALICSLQKGHTLNSPVGETTELRKEFSLMSASFMVALAADGTPKIGLASRTELGICIQF